MQFRSKRQRLNPELNLTPLIDVVLQLLLFFMLSSTFVVQASINVQMPEAKGAPSFEQKDLSVTLTYDETAPGGQGRVFVDNDEMLTMDQLSQRLGEEIAQRPDLRVLIRPDARVPAGRLVQVLGQVHSVGIRRYFIAAKPVSGGE